MAVCRFRYVIVVVVVVLASGVCMYAGGRRRGTGKGSRE